MGQAAHLEPPILRTMLPSRRNADRRCGTRSHALSFDVFAARNKGRKKVHASARSPGDGLRAASPFERGTSLQRGRNRRQLVSMWISEGGSIMRMHNALLAGVCL